MRKSLRTYWFSLNTPFRDGRSETQPDPPIAARKTVPMRAVRTSSKVFMVANSPYDDRSLPQAGDDVGVEDGSVGDDGAAEARVQAQTHAVVVERDVVRVVAVDAVLDLQAARPRRTGVRR